MPSQICSLDDGRKLSYLEFGGQEGFPIFYFHGLPGSRLELPVSEVLLDELGLRLVIPERPGYGRSDFQPNRCLLDWGNDISQLADHLAINKFSTFGFSGGGLYALVCASLLGDRVIKAGIAGCPAPLDAPGMMDVIPAAFQAIHELARHNPWALAQQLRQSATAPESVYALFESAASLADKGIFEEAKFREMYLANIAESLKQGVDALAWDMHLQDTSWGFDLCNVKQEVLLWHGKQDATVSVAMGHYLAEVLPRSSAVFLEGEGHFSLLNHMEAILNRLTER